MSGRHWSAQVTRPRRTIINKLKRYMEENHLSPHDVADLTSVPIKSVRRHLNGFQIPRVEACVKYRELLGCGDDNGVKAADVKSSDPSKDLAKFSSDQVTVSPGTQIGLIFPGGGRLYFKVTKRVIIDVE